MVPIRSLLVVTLALLLVTGSEAAPFAEWLETTSPGGRPVRIWGEGDEFSAAFEAEDGHAALYDSTRRCYVYAVKDAATGALISTGIAVGDETPDDRDVLSGIPLHLRDTSQAAKDERARRRAEDEETFGTMRRWREMKRFAQARREAARRGASGTSEILRAPPSRQTLGTVVGLTLLIDFPVTNAAGVTTGTLSAKVHPGVTVAHLEDLANGENCTRYSNASSVRKYFEDVSCGNLSYTNIVWGWFMAARPREYYDDPDITFGKRARELVTEVFEQMVAAPDYETRYLPLLRQVSVEQFNDGPFFKALNVWIAGAKSPTWSKGLWPHKSNLYTFHYEKMPVEVDGETVYFRTYQISPVTTSPSIGTFCHENGHMICGFPDLYDFGSNGAGVGNFSLMCITHNTNPLPYDAYLRTAAGWVTPKDLPTAPSAVSIANSLDDVWRYVHPSDDTQYYLIENRQKKGRNANLPGSGILVWRCDESGDNRYPVRQDGFSGLATNRVSNELSLEQADGYYHLERKTNNGDASDLWYASNTVTRFNGVFSATGTPCARWRDASAASLRLWSFSNIGDVMTFHCADTAVPPVVDSAIAEAVDASPGIVFWHGMGEYADRWFVTDGTAYDGGTCARSGARENISRVYSHSILHAGVVGPGTLSFRWKVESESSPTKNYDWLAFTHDATTETNKIDGIVGSWEEVTAEIPSGYHVLSWIYRKDFLTDAGEDCGWIDAVTWTPDAASGTVALKEAVDGDWYDTARWDAGKVPAADADIVFGIAGEDYAARVTSPVSLAGTLSVSNPGAGAAATVAISNTVTAVTTNGIAIGDGGKLLVGAGGTFLFDDSSLTPITFNKNFMTIVAGGEFAIDGGRAIFTNYNGNVNVTGTAEKPGVVRLASGSLVLSGREHNYNSYSGTERLIIGEGGRFMQTGGTNDLYSFLSGATVFYMNGGEADVSGDSLWRYWCGYWADTGKAIAPRIISGTGTIRFRENAVLDAYPGTSDSSIYIQPAANKGTSVLEFHDHARFDITRSATGAHSASFCMSGKEGGVARLRLYSDAHHGSAITKFLSERAVGYQVVVGDGDGYAELEITNGTFLAGVRGFRVGSQYSLGTAPYTVTGVVHVTGGNWGGYGAGCLSPGWITPTTIGGDMVGSSAGFSEGTFCGRVEMDGGTYTNKCGHLLIGYGLGEGSWEMNGGSAVVCSDVTYSAAPTYKPTGSSTTYTSVTQYATNNVFAIGCAGGRGSLVQKGGDFRTNLRTFVGGAVSNEFTIYETYLKYFGQTGVGYPEDYSKRGYGDRHNATGYLGVLGGTFTAAHSITVGQDGTGVLEIGPTGTLHAASLVLANNAYTAAGNPAATLKFTFGADGVGTATVTNLVIASGAALVLDMSGYASGGGRRRFRILNAANMEGTFAAEDISVIAGNPTLRANVRIEPHSDGIDVVVERGSTVFIR